MAAAARRDPRPMPLDFELAYQIRSAEQRAIDAVRQVAVGRRALGTGPRRISRTRAGVVDRLEEAVAAVVAAAGVDPAKDAPLRAADRAVARSAARAWSEAERLRWELAMTAAPVARSEARKHTGPFLDEEDLVQEGYIGLLRAAQRFDPDRGIPFRAYARWWVRASMSRAVDRKGRPIRLPACAAEQIRALRDAAEILRAEGQPANDRALARETGMNLQRVRELQACGYVVSLDDMTSQGAPPRPAAGLDVPVPLPEMVLDTKQQRAALRSACERVLSERQNQVLGLRYGLDDGEFRTLAQVGRILGVTKERVRQIERDALQKLRKRGGYNKRS